MRRRASVLIIALLAIDVAAAVALVTPIAGSRGRQIALFNQLHAEYQEKVKKAIPLTNIDQKLKEATAQIGGFYNNRLPARDSDIPVELGKLEQGSNVSSTS